MRSFDCAVVGAGIIGLAHAYHLSRAGKRVVVFERGHLAQGASVRNFGMVWPIGQPPGEMRSIALRSREVWLEALEAAGIWHQRCGSLHLAYHADEMAVLEEFVSLAPSLNYECEMMSPSFVASASPVVKQAGLEGAMWSPSELCVYPRQVVRTLADYLASLGVTFCFDTAVSSVSSGSLVAGGITYSVGETFICTGDDFETLFPERFASFGITRSKLQMLRMRPSSSEFLIGPHLCAGLTLGHYANFSICTRLAALEERFKSSLPDHVRWGIHLLVSQHGDGGLTVGDSHEYGLGPTPFMSAEIEGLILSYLDTFLPLESLEVIERWYGVYAKHPSRPYVYDKPLPGVTLLTAVGGAGMTLSFGIAERSIAGELTPF